MDKKSGRTYYVNPATSQRTWRKPPAVHDDDHTHGHEASPTAEHHQQRRSHSPAQRRRRRAAPSLEAEAESAGGEWGTRTDKKSGRTYYVNTVNTQPLPPMFPRTPPIGYTAGSAFPQCGMTDR